MLTCMNSKKGFHHLNYQMTGKCLTSKTTFSKKANLMKFPVWTYMLVRTWNLLCVFSWCIPLDHEIYTKYKKAMKNITLSYLIKVISYNICSGIKGGQAKKQPFVIQYQKPWIFIRIPLFNFIKSFSTGQFHVCF